MSISKHSTEILKSKGHITLLNFLDELNLIYDSSIYNCTIEISSMISYTATSIKECL